MAWARTGLGFAVTWTAAVTTGSPVYWLATGDTTMRIARMAHNTRTVRLLIGASQLVQQNVRWATWSSEIASSCAGPVQ